MHLIFGLFLDPVFDRVPVPTGTEFDPAGFPAGKKSLSICALVFRSYKANDFYN
jgi:hypothetical protein